MTTCFNTDRYGHCGIKVCFGTNCNKGQTVGDCPDNLSCPNIATTCVLLHSSTACLPGHEFDKAISIFEGKEDHLGAFFALKKKIFCQDRYDTLRGRSLSRGRSRSNSREGARGRNRTNSREGSRSRSRSNSREGPRSRNR